jgi:hypothetical protein
MKFTINLHVPRIGADYEWASVSLYGQEYARFGDAYHDKGADKAEGWCEGYANALGVKDFQIDRIEFHDPACYDYQSPCEVCADTGHYFRQTSTGGETTPCWKC